MRRAYIVGLVAAAWAALAALPAQAVVLRYNPKVGSTIKYKVVMKGDMDVSMAGMPEGAMGGTFSSTMTVSQKVLEKQDNGMKVEMRMSGGTMKMTVAGEDMSQPLPSGQAVLVLDERGRMVEVVSSEGGQDLQTPIPNMQDWGQFAGYGGFPEGDVKAGDVWTDEVKVPGSGMMPSVELQVRSRLVELTTYEGHKVAKISSTFSGPMSMDLAQAAQAQGSSEPIQGTMSGDLQGNFVAYYDYENSSYVHTAGRFTTTMNTQLSGGEAGGPAPQIKVHMTVDMSLVK